MTGRHLALAVLIALSLAAVIAIDQRRRLRGPPPAAASHPPIAVAADPAPDADDDADPLGQPVSAPGRLQVLRRRWFTLGYDNGQREPAWCSYHLAGPIRFHGRERRPARFATDPDVRRPARHEDYSGSGYDRGHLAPAFALWSRGGDEALRATFTTANIVPQIHAMNSGAWERIEALIAGRDGRGGGWAEAYGEVWITDGPVHAGAEASLPGGEPVPAACFLVALRREGAGWTALGFEVPNRALDEPPRALLAPIERIERDTGLDLFPDLAADRIDERAAAWTW